MNRCHDAYNNGNSDENNSYSYSNNIQMMMTAKVCFLLSYLYAKFGIVVSTIFEIPKFRYDFINFIDVSS